MAADPQLEISRALEQLEQARTLLASAAGELVQGVVVLARDATAQGRAVRALLEALEPPALGSAGRDGPPPLSPAVVQEAEHVAELSARIERAAADAVRAMQFEDLLRQLLISTAAHLEQTRTDARGAAREEESSPVSQRSVGAGSVELF